MVACSVLGNRCHRLAVNIDLNVLSDPYEGSNQYSGLGDETEEDKGVSNGSSKHCVQAVLHPFDNQVGGHVALFCPDEFHLCKPYCEREANFYKKMPPEIADFTPAFCGEVKLEVQNGCESYVVLPSTSFTGGRQQCAFCRDGRFSAIINPSARKVSTKTVYRDAHSGTLSAINPWAAECRLRKVKAKTQVDEQWIARGSNHFIIIENITRFYQFPCILDLKVGTRQHGDGVNEKKVMKFIEKCERSTSKKYGVRIGGMQYYDSTSSIFQCANKYQGEALSFDQMQEYILNFFTDAASHTLRRQFCIRVIKRLEGLKKALTSVDGCRLFSASVLIAYDGNPDALPQNNDSVRVCLVDFAHATWKGLDDIQYSGPDDGVLLGIGTVLSILERAL